MSAAIPRSHHKKTWSPSSSFKLGSDATCFADMKVQVKIPMETRAMDVYFDKLYLFFKMMIPRAMLAMREPDLKIMCSGMAIFKFKA